MKGLTKKRDGGSGRTARRWMSRRLAWHRGNRAPTLVLLVLTSLILIGVGHTQGMPEGTMTWGLHFSIAPSFFDPAETTGLATPFLFLYALHDALLKPMPEGLLTPCLAESWTQSPDGLVYEFKLRQGVTFHNGDPLTAADVVFSFQRYKGAGKTVYQEKVAAVEALNAHRVRFQLREPWPDFLLFLGTPATGAGLIVPQKYLEQVGDDGFKRHPIGAGPYKFVSHTPGVDLVLEAHEAYWRKTPQVKRLEFPGKWDPKSPWHDRRVRLAANYAIDRQAIIEAETLGYAQLTGSIVPRKLPYALALEPYPYDPAKAKQLLQEAGYPNGFDAGDITPFPPASPQAEAVANDLGAVGIKLRLRTMERPTMIAAWHAKTLQGVILALNGALSSAGARLENYVASWGEFAYGGYPDLDELFQKQGRELNPSRREELLHELQRLVHERVMFVPIYESAGLTGVGPRVAESALGLISPYQWSGPYEEVRLKP
jgi:peptide/nickel transport system substrate-binding protein